MDHRASGRHIVLGVSRAEIDTYLTDLRSHGYAATTVQAYAGCVAHFARWLTARADVRCLDEKLVERFSTVHLAACTCPGRHQRTLYVTRAALTHLLRVLRAHGHIPPVSDLRPSHICDEIHRFDVHLDQTCGLAVATRCSRGKCTGEFLLQCFGARPISMAEITARDVRSFILRAHREPAPGRARMCGDALRSYFRFRAVTRGDQVDVLVAAIPTVAHWRLSSLPSCLTAHEVTGLLKAFDRRRPNGQRGYAMTRCMVDLGLRVGEVAALRLDDLDWQAGTLTIRRAKSRRADALPLPVSTGQAIAEYLRDGRPRVTSRDLFLRHRAPFDAPITTACVRSAVRIAYKRCGLSLRYTGTHVLRHTAATRMRCAGASLKQVADVLRHRSLDTTTIYTKVDYPTLASVVAPWPGGRS